MKKIIELIAWILVIVGGLNWGLVGFFEYDLVMSLFGSGIVSTVIYDLVGLSAIVLIVFKVMKK
jgi:uncharacterized protein